MVQDTQVGWDAAAINHQAPWQAKFFIIFLFIISLISVIRLSRTMRMWLRTRKTVPLNDSNRIRVWEISSAEIKSVMHLITLTVLVCFLAAADEARSISVQFSIEKVSGIAAYVGSFAEILTFFVVGMATCSLLYALCIVCERQLVRGQLFAESAATLTNNDH